VDEFIAWLGGDDDLAEQVTQSVALADHIGELRALLKNMLETKGNYSRPTQQAFAEMWFNPWVLDPTPVLDRLLSFSASF
jgi:hypothetical protein